MGSTAVDDGLMEAAAAVRLAGFYGIHTPAQTVAASVPDAVLAARRIGFPVALKAVRADIVHKTELEAVMLGLEDDDAVREAAEALDARLGGGIELLVQAMAARGVEMIVGARRDPVFGPVVIVGLGGIFAEALGDVAVRLAPVDDDEARAMVAELRGARLLAGERGRPAADLAALAATVTAAGRLIAEHPEVGELDLNPVICRPDGVEAVDVRIVCGPPAATPKARALDTAALDPLFAPRSIAVVGASRDPRKQGGRLLQYLIRHGYAGRLYAVNPRAGEIEGCTVVADVDSLPEPPDLVCIAVPSAAVVGTVQACGARGARSAIIFTAGFSEVGAAGDALQREVLEAARAHGMRLCGPNTAGLVSRPERMCATMGMAFEAQEIPDGSIALITQSGAIGGSLLSRLWDLGSGFSRWVSVGNEIDISFGEYLAWAADDSETEVISLFVESIREVEDFRAGCERARRRGTPVLAYKTGVSEAGRRAVQSHTAALAGDHAVYGAAFRSLGVIEVDSLQTLNDAATLLSWQPAPRGRRVGVVSASGGACSVVADECARHGLEVPTLSATARAQVAALVPAFASTENPVDVTMEVTVRPEMVGGVVDVLLAQDDLDAVLVMMTTNADPPAIRVADGVIDAASRSDKPVLLARMGADFLAPESMRRYRAAHIPVFPMPDRAVRALEVAARHGESLRAAAASPSLSAASGRRSSRR